MSTWLEEAVALENEPPQKPPVTTRRAHADPPHLCHAVGCPKAVPPKMLMCFRHWSMVPRNLQAEVWRTYREGQEIDKQPSPEYLVAQRNAVMAVASKEGR